MIYNNRTTLDSQFIDVTQIIYPPGTNLEL